MRMQEKILILKVDRMTWRGCVNNNDVTKVVRSVSGVHDVNVSLKDKRATTRFDASCTNGGILKKTIAEAGYPAS